MKYYGDRCPRHRHQVQTPPSSESEEGAASESEEEIDQAPEPEHEQGVEDGTVHLQEQVSELRIELDELKLDNELRSTKILEQHATIESLKLTVETLLSEIATIKERTECAESLIRELKGR
jgi:hypothetical protein